jgi:hypothetical protein
MVCLSRCICLGNFALDFLVHVTVIIWVVSKRIFNFSNLWICIDIGLRIEHQRQFLRDFARLSWLSWHFLHCPILIGQFEYIFNKCFRMNNIINQVNYIVGVAPIARIAAAGSNMNFCWKLKNWYTIGVDRWQVSLEVVIGRVQIRVGLDWVNLIQ